MIPNLGPTELVILLAILLLFFGAGRIPALARSILTGAREFRAGISDAGEEHEEGAEGLPREGK